MQRQPQANYDSPGRESNLEQAVPWPELSYPGELSKSGEPRALAGRESKLDISLKSPWLYLSLILLLWLLLF
jgi:hypothetical protein